MPRAHFNSFLFNSQHYNGAFLGEGANPSTDLVVFDNFSLADNSATFVTDLRDSAPTRDILEGGVPRDDGMFVNADYWRRKEIEVAGYLKKSTLTDLEAFLDTVKERLRLREKNLDITRKDNGTVISVRRYVATLVNPEELFSERQRYHVTLCPYRARFRVHDPFAHDRDYTVVSETMTTSPTNKFAENTGTVHAKPVLMLLFDSASSVTVVNVKRLEPSTGATLEEIEYSGSVAAGDWVAFDSEEKTVQANGTDVEYTGSFLTMQPGGNLYQFTITGTSFNATVTIKHRNAFL